MKQVSKHSSSGILILAILAVLFSFVILPRTTHAATKPSTPSMTGISVNGLTSVTVRWSRVTNANGYRLYRRTVDSGWKAIYTCSSNSITSYTDKNVVPGTQYYYTARGYKRTSSGNVWGNYNTTGISATLSLAAPTLVSARLFSQYQISSIQLQWKSTRGAQGFIIYRKQGGSWVKKADITSSSTTTWYDYDISTGTYQYTVKAYRWNGNKRVYGAYSNTGISCSVYGTNTPVYSNYVGNYSLRKSDSSLGFIEYYLHIISVSGSRITFTVSINYGNVYGDNSPTLTGTISSGKVSFSLPNQSGVTTPGYFTLNNGSVYFYLSKPNFTTSALMTRRS